MTRPVDTTSIPRTGRMIAAVATLWLVMSACGFALLYAYAFTPGPVDAGGMSIHEWPESTSIPRAPGRWSLLMFLHPRCSCSRASLSELTRLVTTAGDALDVSVLLMSAEGMNSVADCQFLHTVRQFKSIRILTDPDGREADRFGARTSGYVVLFDPGGHRAFAGGITIARGHAGDSPGRAAILQAIASELPAFPVAVPVFGCRLKSEVSAGTASDASRKW